MKITKSILLIAALLASSSAFAYTLEDQPKQCHKPKFTDFSLKEYNANEKNEVPAEAEFSFKLPATTNSESIKMTAKNQALPFAIESNSSFHKITAKIPAEYTGKFLRINVSAKVTEGECHEETGWLLKVADKATAPVDAPKSEPATTAPVDAPKPEPATTAPVDVPKPAPATTAPVDVPKPAPATTAPVDAPKPEPVATVPVDAPKPTPATTAPIDAPKPEPATTAPIDAPKPEPVTTAPVDAPKPEPVATVPVETPKPISIVATTAGSSTPIELICVEKQKQ